MSIFKSTLTPTVSSQLKARESVISQYSRDQNFLMYTTGKNSFVRLRSFVDYTSYRTDANSKTKLSEDGRWTGDNLSKKWVLEGGTLYNKPGTGDYSLRAGVGSQNSVYASDLDFNNQGNTSKVSSGFGVDRMYGLRPMPGITSVEVMNKSAYGSLREATINFFCWDRHQLEELEILYMRPGYSCYLEWGWSQYLDHSIASVNQTPSDIKIKTFEGNPLNTLRTDLDDDTIYGIIDNAVDKYKGNYDAMLGYVKNYSWQLMPNGGFQCSTTLISRGEVIDTIKASSNPNILLGSEVTTNTTNEEKPIYSQFEKIFLNLIAHINDMEFWDKIATQWTEAPGQFYSTDDVAQKNKLISEADKVYNDVNTRLINGSYKAFSGTWDDPKVANLDSSTFNLNTNLAVKLVDGGTEEGMGIEYISMNAFIAILTEFFIPKNAKLVEITLPDGTKKQVQKPAVNIIVPNITPCLASEDSVSIDPTTCIIKNTKASFITDNTNGFQPQLYSEISAETSISSTTKSNNIPEFIQSGTNIGTVGQIYVSISKILQIYRNLSGGPDGVDVIKLLQEILEACSFALGGINDFKLYNNKSTVQIFDAKYFETKGKDSKFKFDLIGLKSICRDVKINSRIFSEQSTMIAIGATSGEENANLGDIYTSTQNYFNYGLKDRILKTTYTNSKNNDTITVDGVELKGDAAYYWTIYNNVEALSSYLNINVLGKVKTVDANDYNVTKVPQSNQVINAGSLLKTYHYQINGKDTNFKSLIPFELEITLDGIGGFVVGQIFTIDKSILPRDYYNKNLGFIITGINHSLQNNDWVTNIKTQICLLENDKIEDMFGVDKNLLKKTITTIREEARKKGWLLCALADYMVKQTSNMLYNGGGRSNTMQFDFLKALNDGENAKELFAGSTGNEPSDKDLIKNLNIGSIVTIDDYLKNWYDYNKTLNLPNFPATYNDLITTNIPGEGEKTFNSTKFINFIQGNGNFSAINAGNATGDTYKLAYDGSFIGQVLNDQIANPDDYKNVKGFNIKYQKSTDNKINGQQSISDDPKYIRISTSRPSFITDIIQVYDEAVIDYSVLTLDAFNGMYISFYNYLLKNHATLGLTSFTPPQSFTPIQANTEKITY
jgi:hypothetical protein